MQSATTAQRSVVAGRMASMDESVCTPGAPSTIADVGTKTAVMSDSKKATKVWIGGMNCGGCIRGISRAFEKAGLVSTDVQVGVAVVAGEPSHDVLRAAIEGAGFQVLRMESVAIDQ